MNIAMCYHFVSIIIITVTSLLWLYIRMILLTLAVMIRLCLITQWISSKLWFIIRWIMLLMILKIMIWFSFTKTICVWNYYIFSNRWKTCTYFWSSTNNSNLFTFNMWFIAMFINMFRGVLCTVKWPVLLLL